MMGGAVRVRTGTEFDPMTGLWWVIRERTDYPSPPVTERIAGPFLREHDATASAHLHAAATRMLMTELGATLIDGSTPT